MSLIDHLADNRLHTSAAIEAAGFSRSTIARAVADGQIIRFARGIYVSAEGLGENGVSLAALSMVTPGVVCLGTAAQFHDISDEMPPEIWYAVDSSRNRNPTVVGIRQPTSLVYWSARLLEIGVDTHEIAGVTVRITSPARTVVDLLRYRGKLGEETAAKALSDYVCTGADITDLWDIAQAVGCKQSLAPYFRTAEELQGSVRLRL